MTLKAAGRGAGARPGKNGEAEAHEPTLKIASPFAVTKQMMEALLPEFCEWQRRDINSAEKKEIRRTLRKINRHADVIMACIRISNFNFGSVSVSKDSAQKSHNMI